MPNKIIFFLHSIGSPGVDGEPGRDGPKGQKGLNFLFGV